MVLLVAALLAGLRCDRRTIAARRRDRPGPRRGLLCAVGSSDRCDGSEPGTAVSPTRGAPTATSWRRCSIAAPPTIFFEDDDFVSLPGRLPRLPGAALRRHRPRTARSTRPRPACRRSAFTHVDRLPRAPVRPRGPPAATTAAAPGPATSTCSTGSTTPTASPTGSGGSAAFTSTTGRATRRASTRDGIGDGARQLPPRLQRPPGRHREHRQRHRHGARIRRGTPASTRCTSPPAATPGRPEPPTATAGRSIARTCVLVPAEPIASSGGAPTSRSRRRGRRRSGATPRRWAPEPERPRRLATIPAAHGG